MTKLSRTQFFATIAPIVMFVRQQGSPILPSVRLAQSLLETGGDIPAWNNLGGVKVGSGKQTAYWRGDAVMKETWEFRSGANVKEQGAFRAYRTLYHYYKDQDVLFQNSRYRKVVKATTANEQADQLQAAGYATDPSYATKLIALIKQHNLEQYDVVSVQAKVPKAFADAEIVPVFSEQHFIATAYYLQYTNYVPVRKVAEYLGATVLWKDRTVYVNDKVIDVIVADGVSYAKAGQLSYMLNLSVEWDNYAKVLFIH